jgi:hypothetical protein
MVSRKRASGITLIGFLVTMSVLGFFAYLGMRVIPMYIEYMGVVKAMEQVRSEPNSANMSPPEVRRSLMFKLDTQYVNADAMPAEAIQVQRTKGGAQTLRVRYERRVPFIHNLEILGTFDKTINLSGNDAG